MSNERDLPEEIRKALGLEKGTQIIIGNRCAVMIWNAAIEAAAKEVDDGINGLSLKLSLIVMLRLSLLKVLVE